MSRSHFALAALLAMPLGSASTVALASPTSELIEQTVKFFSRQFAKELGEEGTEQVTKRLTGLAAKYGDEAITVIKPLGPRAASVVDEFGEVGYKAVKAHGHRAIAVLDDQGPEMVRLTSKYGDEVIDVMVKQPGIGAELVQHLPSKAFPAIAQLSSRGADRLVKIAPDYAKLPPEAQKTFVEKLLQGGDDFINYVYKRKKELFVAGAGSIALLSAYKVGDGAAGAITEGVENMFPDPTREPGMWMFAYALPLICLTLIILVWLIIRRRRREKVAERRA